jgi:hypothetical protein
MLNGSIDINRGVTLCVTTDGVEVYMYKDTPGVYLNAYGKPVTEALAARAGFDVEKLGKARRRREMIAQAAQIIDDELDSDSVTAKVAKERDGFRLVNIGLGRHVIEDPDGQRLTPTPVTKEQAERLFDELVPKPAEPVVEKKAAKPSGTSSKAAPIEGEKAGK